MVLGALKGERGLTYADAIPEGNALTAGRWWRTSYSGPPLVSVDADLARAIGLKVGDRLTVGLLGVERSATVASLRRIDWDSLGFNYVLVFSPNTLRDAPHNLAATIDVPRGKASSGLLRSLVTAFPSSSVIETGGLIRDARALLGQVSTAILAASSVAVLAGLAVLLGGDRRGARGAQLRQRGAARARRQAGGSCWRCNSPNTGSWRRCSRWSGWRSAAPSRGW